MRGPSLAVKGGILLVAVFVALKFVLPLFTAPLPMSLIWLYLFLATIGIVVYGTLSGESTEALLGPIFRFLSGEGIGGAVKSTSTRSEQLQRLAECADWFEAQGCKEGMDLIAQATPHAMHEHKAPLV